MSGLLYFEDFKVGDSRRLVGPAITAADIKRFAREFDPLPFHLDEAAAKRTVFKGLIASGLHTVCVAAGVVVREVLKDTAMTGSAGISELRWMRPVRPDDSLEVELTVVEAEPWPGREFGRVRMKIDAFNQRKEQILTSCVDYLFLRNPALHSKG